MSFKSEWEKIVQITRRDLSGGHGFDPGRRQALGEVLGYGLALTGAAALVDACSEANQSSSAEPVTATPAAAATARPAQVENTNTPVPTMTKVEATATLKATGTPAVQLESGGEFTPGQKQEFDRIQAIFKSYWDYWANANPRVVNPDSYGRLVAHVKTDLNPANSDSLGVAYELPDPNNPDARKNLYAIPWGGPQGQKAAPPSTYNVDTQTGQKTPYTGEGPLFLVESGVKDGHPFTLGWLNDRWVNVDTATKQPFEVINVYGSWAKNQWTANDRWIINPAQTLEGDLTLNPDAQITEKRYEDWLAGIYNLHKITNHLTPLVQNYKIHSVDDFINYARSGKPIAGLWLPTKNGLGNPDLSPQLQTRYFMVVEQVKDPLYLDSVAFRALHRNETDFYISAEDQQHLAITDFAPINAYFNVVEISGKKYPEMTLAVASNTLNDMDTYRLTIDRDSRLGSFDPITQNVLAINQGFANWVYVLANLKRENVSNYSYARHPNTILTIFGLIPPIPEQQSFYGNFATQDQLVVANKPQ